MKALRPHLIVLLLYLAVALVITWPLVTVIGTHFAGYPFGDAHEMTRHIWWFTQALRTGAPLIDQPLLGYPDGMPGVILWSDPLQFFPAWLFALVLPLPAAYNLQALLNLALNGWAAWLLMRRMMAANEEKPASFQSPQGLGAWVAGLVFMTAPTIQGHLAGGHGGLLVQWPLPLLALVLWNALRTPYPSRSTVFRIALFTFLVPLGHTLQLIYAVMPLAGAAGITLLLQRRWRALILVMIGIGLGGIALGLFLIPVWGAGTGTQAYTDAGGSVAYSIDLLAPLTPSFNHPLWGNLDTHRVLGVNLVEGSTYIGLIASVLALIGLWRVKSSRWWLLPLLICWVAALGPLLKVFDQPLSISTGGYASFISLPWALVADLPGIELARTPGRFNFVIALIVAVFAGYGVQAFWGLRKDFATSTRYALGRWAVVSLLTILIVFDFQSYWPLPTYDASLPQAVADLREREDVRAVFDIPVDNLLAAKDALWLQTAHEQPLIAGQVTRQTPVSAAKLALLEATLSPALLTTVGADVVILHRHYDPSAALYQRASEALGTPFYEDAQVALFNVSASSVVSPALSIAMPVTNDQRAWHLYAPTAGWFQVPGGDLMAPRAVSAIWADEPFSIQQEPIDSGYRLDAPLLPVPAAGFYTLTLSLEPTCPITTAPLSCPTWPESNTGLITEDRFFIPQPTAEPVTFANGVTLVNALVSSTENVLGLWWEFEATLPAESIRFIKILDTDGTQVAGWDSALPVAIGRVSDRVEIPAGTLVADQTYRVCVGWYTLPDVRRFPVLTPVDGSADGLACIADLQAPGG